MKLAYTVATPDTRDRNMLAWRGDPHAIFDNLAGLGYEGVDLMLRDADALDTALIESACKRSGLRVAALSTGQLSKEEKLALNAEDAEQAVSKTIAVVDLAAAWNAQVNIGTLRGQLGACRESEMARAAEAMGAITEYANTRNVTVAIEPQTRAVCNWLNTSAETIAWMQTYTAEPRILFDVYHAMLEERSIYAALIASRPCLTYVQLSDTNRLAPGQGTQSFGDILRVLHALQYDGFVCVECRQVPDSITAATQAAIHLKPYLQELNKR